MLKIGIQHGLVPYEIASMYIRRDSSPDVPCALEKLVQECVEKLHVLELLQKMGKTQENVMSRSLSTRLVDEPEEEWMSMPSQSVVSYDTSSMSTETQ